MCVLLHKGHFVLALVLCVFFLVVASLVVSTGAVDCLKRLVSKMTSSGMLNF